MMDDRVLFFDLDGTLLRSDKTISPYTMQVLQKCREHGLLLGLSTARGERNILPFIKAVQPDIVISSSGALLRLRYFGHLMQRADSFENTLMLGKNEGKRRRG